MWRDSLIKHLNELKTVLKEFFLTRNNAYEIRYFNEKDEEINKEDFKAIEEDSEIPDDKVSVKSLEHINDDSLDHINSAEESNLTQS